MGPTQAGSQAKTNPTVCISAHTNTHACTEMCFLTTAITLAFTTPSQSAGHTFTRHVASVCVQDVGFSNGGWLEKRGSPLYNVVFNKDTSYQVGSVSVLQYAVYQRDL